MPRRDAFGHMSKTQKQKVSKVRHKPFEELTLMDDYMFAAIMNDPANLRPLLEILTERKITSIKPAEMQKTEKEGYESHGVRLDLYVVDEEDSIYNVEVQTSAKKNLPKRMRYYQSVMDIDVLRPAADYTALGESFVIFICNYDPYKMGDCIYRFENRHTEKPGMKFGDTTYKIVVNTKGSVENVSAEVKELILYLREGMVTGSYSRQLGEAILQVKAKRGKENGVYGNENT